MVVYGASDVGNAFAKAPPAKEKNIDRIIQKHGFKPTVHEPCLYIGDVRGERCIFKHQVDNFALATKNEEAAQQFFDILGNELTMLMKQLSLITLFNGVKLFSQNISSRSHARRT